MTASDHEPFSVFFFIICRLRFQTDCRDVCASHESKNYFVFEEIKAGQGLCRFFFFFLSFGE